MMQDQKIDMLQYTFDLATTNKDRLDKVENKIEELKDSDVYFDKEIYKVEYELEDLAEIISSMRRAQETSGIGYFLKQNWWKLGGFIIGFSTILGAIGEYLYRLPPPK